MKKDYCKDKSYISIKIEQLVNAGGKIISYCYPVPVVTGSKKYHEYCLEKEQYQNLDNWYRDVLILFDEMDEEEKLSIINGTPVTTNVVVNGVLPNNVVKIRDILMEVQKSLEQ